MIPCSAKQSHTLFYNNVPDTIHINTEYAIPFSKYKVLHKPSEQTNLMP